MPRTKRPNKKQEKIADENNAYYKKLDEAATMLKKNIDENVARDIRNLEIAFKVLRKNLGEKFLERNIGDLKNEPHVSENIKSMYNTVSSTLSACDDGYVTENSSTQGSGDRGVKKRVELLAPPPSGPARRSRSADTRVTRDSKNSFASSASVRPRRRSRSAYRTPACSKTARNFPPITPKVAPETPLSLLRQPRQGEMAISMCGSPLMLPACFSMNPNEKANCNIMLEDGTTLSLQPNRLRESQRPFIPFSLMDHDVLAQLEILKENLSVMVKLGQQGK